MQKYRKKVDDFVCLFELYNSADTYLRQIDLQCFSSVFTIVQLLSHVNATIKHCKNMINYK